MRDARQAGQPRMSPQWAMVMARFDDLANHLARVELRLDESDRETRRDISEIRDQIQRTRDEVAQASISQDRAREEADGLIIDHIDQVAGRVAKLERTRKADVVDAMGTAAAKAGRKGATAAWQSLPLTGKITAILGVASLGGATIAGFIEGLPQVFKGLAKIIAAIGSAAD